jgi:hypothetical protein
MKDNDEFIIVICILCTFVGVFIGLVIVCSTNIILPEYHWKCKHAVIINDDPSKTQCVLYKRNDQE